MRAAPAVSVACSGGLPWRLMQTLLPAVAAAACAVWALQHLQQSLLSALPVVTLAAAVSWRLARPAAAALVFDGQRWTCDGAAGQPEVMIDIDTALLLRWRPAPAGRQRWLAVTATEARDAWHGLRVALYAPRRADQPAAA